MIRTFVAVLIFCLTPYSTAGADEPIKIGLTLGLTGKYSKMTDMQVKAYRLWEKDVNSRGGILGKKVAVTILDDKSYPETAKQLYEELILEKRVDFVFSPYSSELVEAIAPVTERHGYPVIAIASADRLWQKGYKHLFGLYTPASKYTVGFLEMLVRSGLNSIAIVSADDAFSRDVAEGSKKWAERFGLNVLLFETFKKGTKDLSVLSIKARSVGADVLIVCGHFDEGVNMLESLKSIGWHPKVYYASVGPATQEFFDRLKSEAEHVFSSSQWEHHSCVNFPGCNEFYDAYIKTYKHDPSYHAAIAYAAGQVLEAAVKLANSTKRNKVRDALSSMDIMTIIGRYGVDRTGMQVRHFNIIIQWQNGRKEVVWPEELRTAKPVFR